MSHFLPDRYSEFQLTCKVPYPQEQTANEQVVNSCDSTNTSKKRAKT